MKNARKLVAAVMALTMVGAFAPMSVFADGETRKTLDTNTSSDTVTATYDAQPSYTVTIPASAKIADKADNAQPQSITAENVLLDKGKKLVVKLESADNTTDENATTFNAKNGDSTVNYNIFDGEKKIALGSNVAKFENKTGEQSVALKFVKEANSTPTVAGTHTETLTFGIKVEEAAVPVAGISLNQTALLLVIGTVDTATLTANVSPDKTVTWSSGDESIATVDENGTVMALSEGTATITATAGDSSASCTVYVNKVTLESKNYPVKIPNNNNFEPIDNGLVTITFDNKGDDCANFQDENGWYFYGDGTVTVTSSQPDRQISKVKFYTKHGNTELTTAPFTVYSYCGQMYTESDGKGTCFNDWGVNKIEVYFK